MTGNLKRLRPYDRPPKSRSSLLPSGGDAAAMGYFAFGALWLLTATGLGTFAALQLVMSSFEFVLGLPFGLHIRAHAGHRGGGFPAHIRLGLADERGVRRHLLRHAAHDRAAVAHPRIGMLGMVIWNVGFAAGLTLLYIPQLADTGALTGFPLVVNLVLILALVLINISFWPTLAGAEPPFVGLAWFGLAMFALAGMTLEAAVVGVLDLDPTVDAIAEAMWGRGISLFWLLGGPDRGAPLPHSAAHRPAPGLGRAGLVRDRRVGGPGRAVLLRRGRPSIGPIRAGELRQRGHHHAAPARRRHHRQPDHDPPRPLDPGPVAGSDGARGGLARVPRRQRPARSASARCARSRTPWRRTEWPFGVAAFALGGAATIGLLAVGEHAWPRMLHRAHRGRAGGIRRHLVVPSAGAAWPGSPSSPPGLFHVGMVADGMTPAEINAALLPDPPRGVGRAGPIRAGRRRPRHRGVPPRRPRPSGPRHHTGGGARRRPGRALIS